MTDLTAQTRRSLGNPEMLSKVVDFAVNSLAENGIHNLIPVPANTFVAWVGYEILRAEGAARSMEIGDGDDSDAYIAATSCENTGAGVLALTLAEAAPNTVARNTHGKYYAAADTIDLKAVTANGLSVGKVRVTALLYRMGE